MSDFHTTRCAALCSLFGCPIRKKMLLDFGFKDLCLVVEFMEENKDLGYTEFQAKVNRYGLDMRNKPKRWQEIGNVLSEINGTLFEPKKRRT